MLARPWAVHVPTVPKDGPSKSYITSAGIGKVVKAIAVEVIISEMLMANMIRWYAVLCIVFSMMNTMMNEDKHETIPVMDGMI